MEIDKKIVKKLIDLLEDLKKSVKDGGEVFASKEQVIEEEIDDSKTIKSPIIGTAYLAPEPGAKPFVELGKKIKKGDTIMIVEAMKTMNHVPATLDGVIKKVSVEDGQPVEFGQVLVVLE
jgi:acetyl-CoA carboxylase biotin carboxyl carrier protein|tara:strand:+ start:27 stop:386 length:360 start_codon:yes stop_codon:yes gene_type:complete